MPPHECSQDDRITRNAQDIQTIFKWKDDTMKMRIAELGASVASLIGIIVTLAVLIVKG